MYIGSNECAREAEGSRSSVREEKMLINGARLGGCATAHASQINLSLTSVERPGLAGPVVVMVVTGLLTRTTAESDPLLPCHKQGATPNSTAGGSESIKFRIEQRARGMLRKKPTVTLNQPREEALSEGVGLLRTRKIEVLSHDGFRDYSPQRLLQR